MLHTFFIQEWVNFFHFFPSFNWILRKVTGVDRYCITILSVLDSEDIRDVDLFLHFWCAKFLWCSHKSNCFSTISDCSSSDEEEITLYSAIAVLSLLMAFEQATGPLK